MFEQAVQQIAVSFKETWEKHLSVSPVLELNGLWPSVSVIDLLTFYIRLETNPDTRAASMIEGSAAYLALAVAGAWSAAAEEVDVRRSGEGITVCARGGSILPPGEEISVELEKALRTYLRQMPFPFPLTRQAARPFSYESNIVSPLALSIMTGTAPAVKAPWVNEDDDRASRWGDLVIKELARQSAEHYGRLYPDEPLGQVAELYLSDLIWPPLLMSEDVPGMTAVKKVLSFIHEFRIKPPAALKLARNLCRSPDESLCCMGLCLAAALAEGEPSSEMLGAAYGRGRSVSLLRRAMEYTRRSCSGQPDWIDSGLKNAAAVERYRLEHVLGFIPWLYLSEQRLKEDRTDLKLQPVLKALCDFQFQPAVDALHALIEADPSDIEVRLQRIRLEMVGGDIKKAQEMLRTLFSEPQADSSPRFYNLWGLCLLELGDAAGAVKYFKAAYSLEEPNKLFKSGIANNHGWALMCSGEYKKAVECFDLSLAEAVQPVTALLNKMFCLWRLGRQNESLEIRKQVFQLSPCDRRVFAGLTLLEEYRIKPKAASEQPES